MAEVVVQIVPISKCRRTPAQEPFATAKNLGHALEPIHPDTSDPALSRWFHAEVDNNKATEFESATE